MLYWLYATEVAVMKSIPLTAAHSQPARYLTGAIAVQSDLLRRRQAIAAKHFCCFSIMESNASNSASVLAGSVSRSSTSGRTSFALSIFMVPPDAAGRPGGQPSSQLCFCVVQPARKSALRYIGNLRRLAPG